MIRAWFLKYTGGGGKKKRKIKKKGWRAAVIGALNDDAVIGALNDDAQSENETKSFVAFHIYVSSHSILCAQTQKKKNKENHHVLHVPRLQRTSWAIDGTFWFEPSGDEGSAGEVDLELWQPMLEEPGGD